jgi:hypothetical protein
MRSCALIRQDLSAYLDGELSPERERWVEGHLIVCSACARHLGELQELARGLRQLPRPSVPTHLVGQILEVFEGERQKASSMLGFLRSVGSLAFTYPKAASAVISLLVTASLVGALFSVLHPIPEVPLAYYQAPIALDAQQYGLLNGEANPPQGRYTFPRLRSLGRLEELLRAAASDHLVVVTCVYPDGRASLVDIVAPSPRMTPMDVRTSFSEVRFEPAKRAGQHPVSTQLVMLVHRLDVTY